MAQDSDGSKLSLWEDTGPFSEAALAQVRQLFRGWQYDHANADHHMAGRLVNRLVLTIERCSTQLAECEAHNRDLRRDVDALRKALETALPTLEHAWTTEIAEQQQNGKGPPWVAGPAHNAMWTAKQALRRGQPV